MLDHLPLYLNTSFILTTLLSAGMLALLLRTASKPVTSSTARGIMTTVLIWLIIQAWLSYSGVYTDYPRILPPNIILFGVLPALITIIILFNARKGKQFIDRLSMQMLSYVHIVRIPVELVLYGLFLNGAVPELMTFEGRNFDILAGITAPFVGFLGVGKSMMGKRSLLAWNFICMALLLNIVLNAVLSTPSPFQQFAFDQPNIAILNFPYSWLPAFIVPLVMFAHLAAIRKLIVSKNS